MFALGRINQRVCAGMSRRSLLQLGSLGAMGLTLPDLLRARAAEGKPPRSVILLWLWGGPPHVDTFDPKPDAPSEYRGPFGSIPSKVPGIRFGELFPQLANRANDLAIVRSMHSFSNDHGVAGTIGLTGSASGGVALGGPVGGNARPSTGSVTARMKGFTPGKPPPYVVVGERLHQGKKPVTGEGAGTLGAAFEPFRLSYSLQDGVRFPSLALPEGVDRARMDRRKGLRAEMEKSQRQMDHSRAVDDFDQYSRQALDLLTAPQAKRAFDLDEEPAELRDRYGRTRFGQSALLARRLAERGVPYVQVNWSKHVEDEQDSGDGGWDLHGRTFDWLIDGNAWIMDTAVSALLDDLKARGMLESTLVLAFGEFGRSPKINDQAGRDHWEHCYSALLAGGGVRGGRTIGHSDKLGQKPADRPVTPADLGATVLHCAGVTTTDLLAAGMKPQGDVMLDLF